MVIHFLGHGSGAQRNYACHRIRCPGGLSSSWSGLGGFGGFRSVGRICRSFMRSFGCFDNRGLADRLLSHCGKNGVMLMVVSSGLMV